MKITRSMRPPAEIRAVWAKLKRLQRRSPRSEPNHPRIDRNIRRFIANGKALGYDNGLERRVHEYIDAHIEVMHAELQEQHDTYLFELDQLLEIVKPLIEHYREMLLKDERRLQEMRYAVRATIEDVEDDDNPNQSQLKDRP